MEAAIPILRIFDEQKAMEHYVGFLGFRVDWTHRFGDNFPVYAQISRGQCVIHLSEHCGDATPGSAIRVRTAELDDFCRELRVKDYKYAKPGEPVEQPWGQRELCITDPFGNRVIFCCEMKDR